MKNALIVCWLTQLMNCSLLWKSSWEVSSVTTQEPESVCDPFHSSSFFEEPPLHSSTFVDKSPSQCLSLTEELSVSVGDPTADSVVQLSPSTTADSVTQPSPSTESLTYTCGCTHILKGKSCNTLFSPQYYQTMRQLCWASKEWPGQHYKGSNHGIYLHWWHDTLQKPPFI